MKKYNVIDCKVEKNAFNFVKYLKGYDEDICVKEVVLDVETIKKCVLELKFKKIRNAIENHILFLFTKIINKKVDKVIFIAE